MQLRKVCNHPDLFEERPIVSSLDIPRLEFALPSCCAGMVDPQGLSLIRISDSIVAEPRWENMRLTPATIYQQLVPDGLQEFLPVMPTAPPSVPNPLGSVDGEALLAVAQEWHSLQPQLFDHGSHSTWDQKTQQTREQATMEHRSALASWHRGHTFQDTISRLESLAESLSQHNATRDSCVTLYGWRTLRALRLSPLDDRHAQSVHRRHGLVERSGLSLVPGNSPDEAPEPRLGVFHFSESLANAVLLPERRISEARALIDTFTFAIPAVRTSEPELLVGRATRRFALERERECQALDRNLEDIRTDLLQPSMIRLRVNFPDKRLLQYDSGKLQTLATLLRTKRAGGHRMLIFTQMSRVLDILENFLSFHGFTYVRLDGSTPPRRRHQVVARFNADERVLCFISSTRSGGLGLNLTGADTVIFYDSDWNPAMDAQAMDRCHRIGQTRPVTVYRLVSEHTIEENILRKAMQKKALDRVVMNEGEFTPDAFRSKESLKQLLGADSEGVDEPEAPDSEAPENWVAALNEVEDEEDAHMAVKANRENFTQFADFDEDAPNSFEAVASGAKKESRADRLAKEKAELVASTVNMSPVERYAMGWLSSEDKNVIDDGRDVRGRARRDCKSEAQGSTGGQKRPRDDGDDGGVGGGKGAARVGSSSTGGAGGGSRGSTTSGEKRQRTDDGEAVDENENWTDIEITYELPTGALVDFPDASQVYLADAHEQEALRQLPEFSFLAPPHIPGPKSGDVNDVYISPLPDDAFDVGNAGLGTGVYVSSLTGALVDPYATLWESSARKLKSAALNDNDDDDEMANNSSKTAKKNRRPAQKKKNGSGRAVHVNNTALSFCELELGSRAAAMNPRSSFSVAQVARSVAQSTGYRIEKFQPLLAGVNDACSDQAGSLQRALDRTSVLHAESAIYLGALLDMPTQESLALVDLATDSARGENLKTKPKRGSKVPAVGLQHDSDVVLKSLLASVSRIEDEERQFAATSAPVPKVSAIKRKKTPTATPASKRHKSGKAEVPRPEPLPESVVFENALKTFRPGMFFFFCIF
jgi:superfamily II DNA or RNA helicase